MSRAGDQSKAIEQAGPMSDTEIVCVILAGGQGKRLRSSDRAHRRRGLACGRVVRGAHARSFAAARTASTIFT